MKKRDMIRIALIPQRGGKRIACMQHAHKGRTEDASDYFPIAMRKQ